MKRAASREDWPKGLPERMQAREKDVADILGALVTLGLVGEGLEVE